MVSSNNAIYNTVGASISGVTNTLSVTNPSNTASSQANCVVTVGGTTAGDAWNQWSIGGTRSYCLGQDNSDSQKLKINTAASASIDPSSGTNLWKMTSSGIRNIPLQPCFYVNRVTTDIANVTGDGTLVTVAFNNTSLDQGSNVTTNNTFTCPAFGLYRFGTLLAINGLAAAHTSATLTITQNGAQNIQINTNPVAQSVGGACSLQVHGVFLASAGDVVVVKLSVTGGAKTVSIVNGQGTTNFYGHLLY